MKCWALPDKTCSIESKEVPLAVCEVCIKAYVELLRHPLVRRAKREG